MAEDAPRTWFRPTLIGVLVVGFILFLIGSGLVVFINNAREGASRVRCVSHLKQIALAAHTYADANNGMLPTEASGESVFFQLLPYIYQNQMWQSMNNGGQAGDVLIYVCPARRTPAGARGDYGYGKGQGDPWVSVLAAPRPGVALGAVNAKDGSSHTLLLSHKGVNTDHYDGSGPNDTGWNTLDHARSDDGLFRDCSRSERDLSTLIAAPHRDVCPSAWCDGHVSNIPYSCTIMRQLWSYKDDGEVSPP